MKLRQGLLAQSLLSAPLVAGYLLCAAPVMAQPVQGLYIAGEGGATFNQDQRYARLPTCQVGETNGTQVALGLALLVMGLATASVWKLKATTVAWPTNALLQTT